MRRYLFNSKELENNNEIFDVIIVGGGLAGLYCALNVDSDKSVAIIVKGHIDGGSSYLAQGGIAAVTKKWDSFDLHVKDTLIAGAGHCDEKAVRTLVTEGPEIIDDIIRLGVPFDRDENGETIVTREGGHSCRRILHCGGDATGKIMTETLGKEAQSRKNIKIFFDTFFVDVVTDKNGTSGVVVNNNERNRILFSRNVVIATGSIGQLYKYSTNPKNSTGDGIAACLRAGTPCKDMEFVQFHPTALAKGIENGRMFLVSEAVRGEGGILKNSKGEAFMYNKHSLRDLAPRDIVTREILKDLEKTGDQFVYLDVSDMSEEFFASRFPTIFQKCRSLGIHVPSEHIPVHPTEHYMMGGVKTDIHARTAISGLYACGETACTGVQGANRLASNSTLECLVFGRRAARNINADFRSPKGYDFVIPESEIFTDVCPGDEEIEKDIEYMKSLMTKNVGAIRHTSELEYAHSELDRIYDKYRRKNLSTVKQFTVFNAAMASTVIAESACARRESMGSHYIVD
ncbi:MAG: L-aspartate oxidase [Clostridia bacterium]|nr:L-aspartate oxidase [Clostridia bacterium]